MKKHLFYTAAFVVLSSAGAWAQQNDREQARKNRAGMIGRASFLGSHITSQEVIDKVGIQGEQAAKLKTELDALDKKAQTIKEEIGKAALEQAEIAKKVMAEPGASDEELMKQVERIGKLRTEQAKLVTKRLIVLRDHLTTEQRQKVFALLNQEKKGREEHEGRERNAQNNPRPAAPKGW